MGETDPNGAPVHRYGDRELGHVPPRHLDDALEEALTEHRELFLGPAPTVWHEIFSDTVHVDVWPHATRAGRGATLVTQGASALVSETPPGIPGRLECLTYVTEGVVEAMTKNTLDAATGWPLAMLKTVARFPHDHATWLGQGHSLAFADPPAPIAPDSLLTSVLLLSPPEAEGFGLAEVAGTSVRYLWVMPITTAEADMKRVRGRNALLDVLTRARVPFVCDAGRSCSVTGARP